MQLTDLSSLKYSIPNRILSNEHISIITIMQRRQFIQTSLSAAAAAALPLAGYSLAAFKDVIIGHNSHQYTVDVNWVRTQ